MGKEEQKDSEYGLPPKITKWPTEAEFREAAAKQEDPFIRVQRLRQRVPLADWKTLHTRIK